MSFFELADDTIECVFAQMNSGQLFWFATRSLKFDQCAEPPIKISQAALFEDCARISSRRFSSFEKCEPAQ
jgi:hypothetical protein